MSLVAYDSSDESEEEQISKPNSDNNLLNAHVKKRRGGVKITVPSLKEFEDDEEAPVVKKSKTQVGSGLFSILPPPKNTSTLSKPGFMPHILKTKKDSSSIASTKATLSKGKNDHKEVEIESVTTSALDDEQDSDEENSSITNKSSENSSRKNDFFWLDDLASSNKTKEENISNFSLPLKKDTFSQSFFSLPSASSSVLEEPSQKETENVYNQQYQQLSETDSFQANSGGDYEPHSYSLQSYSVAEAVTESDTKESLLKDKEFLKFQGRRKEFENMDIIDVKADDQLTDKSEWLIKNLSGESTHRPTRRRHDMPTQQQKRKHQITYLAFQAKEREMDLKNQWGLNSQTRRETQAKYGF